MQPLPGFYPVPKPKHKRGAKTAKQRGQITPQVYAEAWNRDKGRCRRCGAPEWQAWTLEAAHVERRWKYGQEGVTKDDVVILCGPSTDSRTCHHWADYTKQGREWLLKQREQLRARE